MGGVSATSAALDQIVEDVNLVFRQELAIELELVPNNDSVIFTNAASDGYTNGAPNSMATQNPTVLNGALGTGTYDIGHVLGTTGSGASGLAFLPTLGVSPTARGATVISSLGLAAPVMLHEIGHMLGARHTFNGTNGFCTASERDGDTAYEPGSGSTIMSYQGICGSDDLPVEPGDATYFHVANFEQILDYLNSIPTVGTSTSTSNSVPTIDAGADYTIPASTPFEITATGSDVDSQDVLTYTWEQIDSDPAGSGTPVPISSSADDVGPLFRSYAPTTDPTRVFPRLEDILNNTPQVSNVNEHLPTQSRTMNFRATVRDNHEATISGQTKTVSGVNSDDMIVTVVDTGNPFQVTNPNSAVTWTGGASETVTWNVAGTDANGINASNVQILLSTDGGNSFPYLLATTSNDGSHSLTVPNVDTSSARLKIKGDGNLFFDLSNEDFSINSNASLPGVSIVESAGSTTVSESGTAATDTYTVSLNTVSSSGAVDVLIAADAESLVSTDGVTFATSQTISFTSTSPQTVTVKAVNDSNDDGPGTSLLSHAISSSSSSEYPTTALINQVVATVIDDEIPPVVGVDYDCCGSTSTPTDWTQLTFLNASTSNLTFDNGIASSIDFSAAINGGGSLGVSTGTPLSGTIPQHIPLLSGLDGSSNFQSGITYTFSSLAPGVDYSVFVFGLDVASSGNYSQTVSISGGDHATDL